MSALFDNRVKFIFYRHPHHSAHGGYDRLTTYGGRLIVTNDRFRDRVFGKQMMNRIADGVRLYREDGLQTEIKAALHLALTRGCIYHILYGDRSYRYLGHVNGLRRNRLVATYHAPPWKMKGQLRKRDHLKRLSAIICVGSSQVEFFADLVGPEKVHFVPHGIDTEFFTPGESNGGRDANRCLFVGTHLRDFATLREVIDRVARRRPEVRFTVVTKPKSLPHVGTHPNLETFSNLPESDLREHYRTATLLVMPLIDATANNSILEASACGLPMVVTDVGSVRDYLDTGCASLTPVADPEAMADEILRLLDDDEIRAKMSLRAREKSMKFAWPEIVEQMKTIYRSIE